MGLIFMIDMSLMWVPGSRRVTETRLTMWVRMMLLG